MNKSTVKHIPWLVFCGVVCMLSACNNYSVSEKQEESFLKYFAVGVEENAGTEVIQTSDGYAILGNFEAVSDQKDIFVVFTDKFGRQKTSDPVYIGMEGLDNQGHGMIPFPDGGYLISGTSYNAAQKWGYLVNISSDGRILWERNYSGYQELVFRKASIASDGNLIITGYGRRSAGDDTGVIIFKTETDGDSLWSRFYSLPNFNDVGEAIIESQNRYHILTTSTEVSNINHSHIRMLNTNTDGRFVTSLSIYDPQIDESYLSGKDITIIGMENIYILGNFEDPATRVSEIYLAQLELTQNGTLTNLVNAKRITDPEAQSHHAASFTSGEQGNLAIGGWHEKPNDIDILFLQVSADADYGILMRKTFGTEGYQSSQHIISTQDDGGFALTGSVDLGGSRTSMLLKIDRSGELQ